MFVLKSKLHYVFTIHLIVSHSAPTDMALDIAEKSNITMVGFARGNRMSIYCGSHRLII